MDRLTLPELRLCQNQENQISRNKFTQTVRWTEIQKSSKNKDWVVSLSGDGIKHPQMQ